MRRSGVLVAFEVFEGPEGLIIYSSWRSCDIIRQVSQKQRLSPSCQVVVSDLIFCMHINMNRSDLMKSLANAPRAKYSGSFLPTVFNHDSVLALGVEPERAVAEYFSDHATYKAVLN